MDGKMIRVSCAVLLTLLIAVSPATAGTKFSHVVIIVQENRSPDNLFGSRPDFEPGVDIRASGLNSEHQIIGFSPVSLAGCYDLGHSHRSFEQAYDSGAMDGENKVAVTAKAGCLVGLNPQYRYVDNSRGTV